MQVKDAYLKTMLLIARTHPHLYFLSKYLRVVYDENAPLTMTNGKVLIISPTWLEYDDRGRYIIFLHELYHVLLKHPVRAAQATKALGCNPDTALIACDAKVNYLLLLSLEDRFSRDVFEEVAEMLPTYNVDEELLEKGSIEEIIKWLMDNQKQPMSPTFGNDIVGGDSSRDETQDGGQHGNQDQQDHGDHGGSSGQGDQSRHDDRHPSSGTGRTVVLNEGSETLRNTKDDDELDQKLTKIIRDSLLSAKMAGATLTAIEERIVQFLTKSKVNWRSLLRSAIQSYIRNTVVQSYQRPNRRFSHLPGIKSMSKPNAWVFIDLSGSTSEREFNQFMSEVKALTQHVNSLKLITWDTFVTGEYDIVRGDQIGKIQFRGGGGTRFAPVISQYLDKIKSEDVVIVQTDGIWYDKNTAEPLVKKIRAFKVAVTTSVDLDFFDRCIRIEVEKNPF